MCINGKIMILVTSGKNMCLNYLFLNQYSVAVCKEDQNIECNMYCKIYEICKMYWKWFPATGYQKKDFFEIIISQFDLSHRFWTAF